MNSSEGIRLEHKSLPSYLPCGVGDLSGEQWWEIWGNKGFDRKSVSQGKWCDVQEGFSLERWKGVLTRTQFIILPVIGALLPWCLIAPPWSEFASLILVAESWREPGAHSLSSLLSSQTNRRPMRKESRCLLKAFGGICSGDDLWFFCRMHGASSLNFFFQLLCFYFWLLTGS